MDPGGNLPRPLFISTSSDMRQSVMGAYHLPQNMGSIVGRYESMNDDDEIFQSSPGEFIYAETLLPAGFRGAFDDGLMDTVVGSSQNRNREVRLEYSNTAWQTARTRATWSAGFRNVDHNELLQVTYYALVPNLPTIIPPIVDEAQNPAQWHPIPDRVVLQSDYMGTGAGAALDAEFTFHPRFSVISGLSVGLLRGKVTTTYKGFTSYYTNALEGGRYVGRDELFQTLQFGTQNEILAISQRVVEEGYYAPDVSQSAQTFDAYVGVQSIVWRGLRVFATFREMYYQNVATDAVLLPDLTLETEKKSVGYEGYLVGVSWRF
jgi:hypothetical protein